jgi:hypothetical protein
MMLIGLCYDVIGCQWLSSSWSSPPPRGLGTVELSCHHRHGREGVVGADKAGETCPRTEKTHGCLHSIVSPTHLFVSRQLVGWLVGTSSSSCVALCFDDRQDKKPHHDAWNAAMRMMTTSSNSSNDSFFFVVMSLVLSSSSFSKYEKIVPMCSQRQYLLVIVVSNKDISPAVVARRTAMTMTMIGLQMCLKAVVVITCDDLHHDMKSIPLIVMMVSYLASLLMMITETTSITTTNNNNIQAKKEDILVIGLRGIHVI